MPRYYDEEPHRYADARVRPRERGEPDYVREETYIERGKGPLPRNNELVYRGHDDSIEDIPRDFPPPAGSHARRGYRTRSTGGGRRYVDDYDRDDRSYYGAAPRRDRRDRDRRRRRDRGYDSECSDSPSPPRRKKSGVEEILGGLGLGGVVGALAGKKSRDGSGSRDRSMRSGRSRDRMSRRRRSSSSSSSRGGGKGEKKWAKAAQAALIAGAAEAFQSRKDGPWTGERGKRVATAALGAGGLGKLLDRDPDENTKRNLAGSVLGGLATSRLVNGARSKSRGRGSSASSRSRSRGPRSRSRSVFSKIRGRSTSRFGGRSRSRGRSSSSGGGGVGGAVKGLAATGLVAGAGKAIYDRMRSKSRKGSRDRSRSSSADSYVPSRRRQRDRRGSPTSDMAGSRRGLAVVGRDRDRGRASPDISDGLGAGAGAGAGVEGIQTSDTSSTTDMEAKRKKMKGKELLTAGLATIATIHAAHGVYSSMEAHETRHKLVADGEMSREEARKKQTKAWVQDAAAVGIAALGIKGAFSVRSPGIPCE